MKFPTLATHLVYVILVSSIAGSESPEIPAIDQIAGIELFSSEGWRIKLEDDGAASLSLGSGPLDVARTPKATFSLRDVYDSLLPSLTDKATGLQSIALFFRFKTPVSTRQKLYLEDEVWVKDLFARVRDSAVAFDEERFSSMLKRNPPFREKGGN